MSAKAGGRSRTETSPLPVRERTSKAIAIENDLRVTLRNFGLKVGVAGTAKFEARIKELVENLPDLAALVEPLLVVRRCYANRSSFCIADCWRSSETMRCAGV